MMESKKELIKKYNEGELKDLAVYSPSAFDAYILCEWNEDEAFGYYQYMNDKKEFFKVKTNLLQDDISYKIKGRTIKGSNFMRINSF